jgi:multiple sugar transport system permease protein
MATTTPTRATRDARATAGHGERPPRHGRDSARCRRRENLTGYAFLAPQLIGLVAFMVGPLVFALVLSVSHWDGFGTRSFAGLENFTTVFTDPRLTRSAWNTLWFTLLQVPGLMLSGFLVALLLQRAGRMKSFYRTFYFAPVVTSTVAVAAIWLWLFNPEISPVNNLLRDLGLPAPNWLQDAHFVIPAFAIVGIWQGLGYQVVMFMAGLDNIPRSLLEAAELDGAGELQKLRKVTLPLLSPTILFLSITSIIGSFQVFDYIFFFYETTAPANARTIVYEIVNIAFREFRFGFASAIAIYLFIVLLIVTGLQLLAQKRWVHYTE